MPLEQKYSAQRLEAGTDEAGRGCLAGPVTAAAVILPPDYKNSVLNDSKKLSETQRNLLKTDIETNALSFAVCHVFPDEIDQINILSASIKAMHGALAQLAITPEYIIVDGNRFKPFLNIPYQTIVKGDAKFLSIAAASVLAKTRRDEYMRVLHEQYPEYSWNRNKGYPTQAHRAAIKQYGITELHRKSFRLLYEQLCFDFE